MRRFLAIANDKLAFAAAIYMIAIALVVIVGPVFVDPDVLRSNLRARNLAPFQLDHGFWMILGGDALGRSLLARLIVGGSTTLAIAGSAVAIGVTISTTIGIIAGMSNAWWSTLIMRVFDVMMSIPSLLLAMVILYTLGAHPVIMVSVLIIGGIPDTARVARGQTLEIRERPFVAASRVMGASPIHLVLRHVAPNVIPTMLPFLALGFAGTMLAESTLTFLGIGIQPPDVTWGLIIAEGRDYLRVAWWSSLWPGLLITTMALSATIIGNWYQVAADPTLRARHGKKVKAHA